MDTMTKVESMSAHDLSKAKRTLSRGKLLAYLDGFGNTEMADEDAHAYEVRMAELMGELDELDVNIVEFAQAACVTGNLDGRADVIGTFDLVDCRVLLRDAFDALDTIPDDEPRMAYVRTLARSIRNASNMDMNLRPSPSAIRDATDLSGPTLFALAQDDLRLVKAAIDSEFPASKEAREALGEARVISSMKVVLINLLAVFYALKVARRALAVLGRLQDPVTEMIVLINSVRLGRRCTEDERLTFFNRMQEAAKRTKDDRVREAIIDALLSCPPNEGLDVTRLGDVLRAHEGPSLATATDMILIKGRPSSPFTKIDESGGVHRPSNVGPQKIDRAPTIMEARFEEYMARRNKHAEEGSASPDHLRLCDELFRWLQGPFELQKPDGSAYHKLVGAQCYGVKLKINQSAQPKIFVVMHDWAKAFATAEGFAPEVGDEYRLPFDGCCFEFRISGRRVCLMVDGPQPRWDGALMLISMTEGKWYGEAFLKAPALLGKTPTRDAFTTLLENQVRAICIALEAQAAETYLMRGASEKLNKARAKKGKPLIRDYHVVHLAKRHRARAAASPGKGEPRWRVRCHFRRGHWRHYDLAACQGHDWRAESDDPQGRGYCRHCAGYRRWVKWMLVGDPDLGFVDKHYTL